MLSGYLLPQNLPRDLYVGTTIYFFAFTNIAKLLPYTQLDLLHIGNLHIVFLLLPVSYLGIMLGFWLNQRTNDSWFNRIIYSVLLLTGIQLLFDFDIIGLLRWLSR